MKKSKSACVRRRTIQKLTSFIDSSRMVHGAWCMVHGAWCMVHGAWCMMHGACYLLPLFFRCFSVLSRHSGFIKIRIDFAERVADTNACPRNVSEKRFAHKKKSWTRKIESKQEEKSNCKTQKRRFQAYEQNSYFSFSCLVKYSRGMQQLILAELAAF